jgi:hypothetical protein
MGMLRTSAEEEAAGLDESKHGGGLRTSRTQLTHSLKPPGGNA